MSEEKNENPLNEGFSNKLDEFINVHKEIHEDLKDFRETEKPIPVKLQGNARPKDEFKDKDILHLLKSTLSKSNYDIIKGIVEKRDFDQLRKSLLAQVEEQFKTDATNFNNNLLLKENNYYSAALEENAIYPLRIELIYNYWLDEGYLNKSVTALVDRYRNRSCQTSSNLLHLTLNPLQNINNLLRGYVRETKISGLLSAEERSTEYQNQYGYLVSHESVRPAAEVRSDFHKLFNILLTECYKFYKQAEDTTITPDAFPVLTALGELNHNLAYSNYNQSHELLKQARTESFLEQSIMDMAEVGEYLKERPMVNYRAPWMSRVECMKSIQRWQPVSIKIFNELAEYGEVILLSVRYIDWMNTSDTTLAEAWAMSFKDIIKKYIFNYNIVTGVDLTSEHPNPYRNMIPGALIRNRMKKSLTI